MRPLSSPASPQHPNTFPKAHRSNMDGRIAHVVRVVHLVLLFLTNGMFRDTRSVTRSHDVLQLEPCTLQVSNCSSPPDSFNPQKNHSIRHSIETNTETNRAGRTPSETLSLTHNSQTTETQHTGKPADHHPPNHRHVPTPKTPHSPTSNARAAPAVRPRPRYGGAIGGLGREVSGHGG